MNISPNVKIMTADEYAASGDAAFERGVEYGKMAERGAAALKAKPAEPIEVTMRCNFEFVETPPKPQTLHRPVFYYWNAQRAAVVGALPLPGWLKPISEPEQMRGIEGGVFVDVCGHPNQPPLELYEIIRAYGWTVIRIDDSFARSRARNR